MRIDPNAAAAEIDVQFPELAPSRVHRLGEGCDSVAFEVNATWVFRFPKNADVARRLEVEWATLPMLVGRLPVAIPEFRYRGTPTRTYPYPFAGYAKLPGVMGGSGSRRSCTTSTMWIACAPPTSH